jgi:uncharacterized protein
MSLAKDTIPALGVGLGYRSAIHNQIMNSPGSISWLEIISDQFVPLNGAQSARLAEITELFACIPHSLELSIASTTEPPAPYVAAVCEVVRAVDARWFSDHLAFNRLSVVNMGSFMPPFRDMDAVARIARRVRNLQQATGKLMLLENIASIVEPGGPVDEPTFLNLIAEEADCGILLDLANLHGRCLCTGWDPHAFLGKLNLERVVQIHLAGGRWRDGYLRDTHDQPVDEHVWEMLTEVCQQTDIKGILLERDDNFPDDFAVLLDELARARQILARAALEQHSCSTVPGESAMTAARLGVSSQEQLERVLEGYTRGCGRGDGRPGDEWHHIEAFFSEAASKRINFIEVTFPVTLRLLEAAYATRSDLARDYFRRRPRQRALEDEAGFKAAEIEQFKSYVADLAAELAAPELDALALLESEISRTAFAQEKEGGQEAHSCSCNYSAQSEAELVLCPSARLALRRSARLITLPFDAVRVGEEILGDPAVGLQSLHQLAAEHKGPTHLAIAISDAGPHALFRLGKAEFSILTSPHRYREGLAGTGGPGTGHGARWTGKTATVLRIALRSRILAVLHDG